MKMFPLVLAGVLAAVVYVTWHLWRIAPGGWPVKLTVAGLFVLWMVLTFASLGFSEKVPIKAAVLMQEVGMPWLIVFLYLLLVFLVADICAICRILPKGYMHDSAVGLGVALGVVAVLLVAGGIHYRHKFREDLTIHTVKPLEQPLTVVLASDLHIGYTNRRAELARWIDLINAAEPDLVLFGGDVLDMRLRPVVEGGYAEEFRRLKAPAYAVVGNHEFYGDIAGAERFYADAGIVLLRDSTAHFQGIRIIGRDDRSNRRRLPLAALIGASKGGASETASQVAEMTEHSLAERPEDGSSINRSAGNLAAGEMTGIEPVAGKEDGWETDQTSCEEEGGRGPIDGETAEFTILLDHQPMGLEETEAAGIDFQFSGHTHRGQVWPLSLVTDAIFEKAWGHHSRGATRYYISSGLGIWGPKIRLGTRSEYLVLTLTHTASPQE